MSYTIGKPMLAATCDDMDKLRYPLMASPKIDGIRCLNNGGVPTSRSLKPIPNVRIANWFKEALSQPVFHGLDGELDLNLVGDMFNQRRPTFQEVSSAILSSDGEPDFVYRIFDIQRSETYARRVEMLKTIEQIRAREMISPVRIDFLLPVFILNRAELDAYLASRLALGDEGVMVRSGLVGYKHGRSTFNEHGLIKIKPFEDDDATIVGFEEQMHNANEATINALGRTERSSHQANKYGKDTLGAIICESAIWPGVTFNVGTGFDDATRHKIWSNKSLHMGRTIKYKYQKIGSLDRPRCPVFLGFRDELDKS